VQQTSKDIDGAIATYRSVLDSNPRLDVAANNLAALVADFKYKNTAELDSALQLAQRFQSSENPYFLDTLGWLHYRKGDYSLAVVFLRKAQDAKPDHPQLNLHLGLAYYKSGNPAEARRYLEKAITLGDGNPEIVAEAQAMLKAL
jgi:Flp pilus assembly protein TadD